MTQFLVTGSSVCNDFMNQESQSQGFFSGGLQGKKYFFVFIRIAERVIFVGLEHQAARLPPEEKNLPENEVNTEQRKADMV